MVKLRRVCVAGLGQVGLPTAIYIKNRRFEVWGFDVNSNVVKYARAKGIKATTNMDKIPPIDVYIICVSTSLKHDKPDLSSIYDVCDRISRKEMPCLISVESTVVPGTCRKLYNEFFNETVNLVHVPHRYWTEDPVNHGVCQTRVIGGINEKSLNLGFKFYNKDLGVPLYKVSSIEAAGGDV